MDKMIDPKKIKDIKNEFGAKAKLSEPLAPYTTFKAGGPADIFIVISTLAEARKVISYSNEFKIPVFILGGGSNILVSDSGFRGIVMKNELDFIELEDSSIYCGSGVPLDDFLRYAQKNALSNLEFMSGIYGTVGGAVVGNAGAYGHSIGEYVEYIEIVDSNGKSLKVERKDLEFLYRKMKIKSFEPENSLFVSGCRLKFEKGEPEKIKRDMDGILKSRDGKMPQPVPSAGCFFKNIECSGAAGKISAGMLLEQAAAKENTAGRVGVHPRHANILMNRGGASASEILEFAENLKKEVFKKHKIELEYEVKLVGDF